MAESISHVKLVVRPDSEVYDWANEADGEFLAQVFELPVKNQPDSGPNHDASVCPPVIRPHETHLVDMTPFIEKPPTSSWRKIGRCLLNSFRQFGYR